MDAADFSLKGAFFCIFLLFMKLNRPFLSVFQEKKGILIAYFGLYDIMLTDICNIFSLEYVVLLEERDMFCKRGRFI